MNQRWGSTQWVLVFFGVVLIIFGVEYGRMALAPPPPQKIGSQDPVADAKPPFKVGEAAPDFTLADSKGTPHSLSSLVKDETILCFTCGCGDCRHYQTYLHQLLDALKKNKKKVPQVVSVTTMEPEAEAAWIRDTKLPHTILYNKRDKDDKSPMDLYKGHPCPRGFGLKPDRTVRWIGNSKIVTQMAEPLAMELAGTLGFSVLGRPEKGKITAPRPEFMPPVPPTPPEGYNPSQEPPPQQLGSANGAKSKT